MKARLSAVLLVPFFLLSSISPSDASEGIVAIHLLGKTTDSLLVELGDNVPALAEQGIDLIFLEVDYSFDFQSHPELRQGDRYITRAGAQRLAEICRTHDIRLIPEFQSLGHQSWAAQTFPLLTVYPELDLTPGAFPENEGIYCREWDPTNPRVNQIVFPLIDEIVEAFDADGIHVGMDEIFLLDSEHAPNTKDKDPAELFAQVVNEFHDHFVKDGGLEMFLWGDRLIDGTLYPHGEYESSLNGTAAAVDMIPTDIVICDWHYEPLETYSSIPMFLDKGFRVLPSSWRKTDAVEALVKYSYSLEHPNMMGHLLTTWGNLDPERMLEYPPLLSAVRTIEEGLFFDVSFHVQSVSADGRITIAMAARGQGLEIRFTDDGTLPDRRSTRYENPVAIDESTVLKAISYRDGVPASAVSERRLVVHKATGRAISLATPASPQYPAENGAAALVNGSTGSASYADGQWVGAEGTDLEALIDLGGETVVSRVAVTSMNNWPNWVHHSRRVEVSGSTDGDDFTRLGEIGDIESDEPSVSLAIIFDPVTTRYLRVVIYNQLIPEGYSGAGEPAWLFVDEIVVE
jgi:hypothetical protein